MDLEQLKLDLPREKEASTEDGRKLLLIKNAWPFQRLMARLFDTILFTAVAFIPVSYLWNQMMTMVFFPKVYNEMGVPYLQRVPYNVQVLAIPICVVVAFILSVIVLWAVEPLLLRGSGGTPGKGIMHLAILDQFGEPVKPGRAFKRTCQVFSQGLGFYIPVYSQILAFKAYKSIKSGKLLTKWDESNKTVVVCVNPKGTVSGIVTGVIICAILIVISYLVVSNFFGLTLNPMTDAEYEAARTTSQAVATFVKNIF